jgi:hypothetical protein
VLFVRSFGQDRDGALAKHADKDTLMLAEGLDAAAVFFPQTPAVERSDASPDDDVGQAAGLCKVNDYAHGYGGRISGQNQEQ